MIAEAIRAKGYEALAMADVCRDLRLPDSDWMRRAGREGWGAISKDNRIPRDHSDTLSATTLRLFLIPNSNMSGADMVTRMMDNWDAILRRTATSGPYVYAILPNKLEKRWP